MKPASSNPDATTPNARMAALMGQKDVTDATPDPTKPAAATPTPAAGTPAPAAAAPVAGAPDATGKPSTPAGVTPPAPGSTPTPAPGKVGSAAFQAGYLSKNGNSGDAAHVDRLSPDMQNRIAALGAIHQQRTGQPLPINSSHRSYDEQAALYNSNNPYPVARPGSSRHETGSAVDIPKDLADKYDRDGTLASVGLGRPVANDPVHLQPINNAPPLSADHMNRIASLQSPTPSSAASPGTASATPSTSTPGSKMALSDSGVDNVLALTGRLETGATGSANISNDTGGSRSYGRLGLNSGSGSAADFASRNPDLGLTGTPGTSQFDSSWRAAAQNNPDKLQAAERNYYRDTVISGTQDRMAKAGIPDNIRNDPRAVGYFADREIQQGKGATTFDRTKDRVQQALGQSGGDTGKFLSNFSNIEKTQAARQQDFPRAIASGVYPQNGHEARVNGRLAGAMELGDQDVAKPGTATAAASGTPKGNTQVASSDGSAPAPKLLYHPVDSSRLSGTVGSTSASMGAGRHQGVDVMAPRGSPVYAPDDGKVTHIGKDNFGQPTLTIEHPDGKSTRYLHMGDNTTKVGDTVKGGQQVGTSGTANGVDHLHVERWAGQPGRGTLLNPRDEFGWGKGDKVQIAGGSQSTAGSSTQVAANSTPSSGVTSRAGSSRSTPAGSSAPSSGGAQVASADTGVPRSTTPQWRDIPQSSGGSSTDTRSNTPSTTTASADPAQIAPHYSAPPPGADTNFLASLERDKKRRGGNGRTRTA